MKQHITVLGAGAWGTAIALVLADNGHDVTLWAHEQDVVQDINFNHKNTTFLPGFSLPQNIHATNDMSKALASSTWIFQAIPTSFLRINLEKARPFHTPNHTWITLSKGIEQQTLLLPSQVVQDVLGEHVRQAILAGPSFAKELAAKAITAVNIASTDEQICHDVCVLLENTYFKLYPCHDVLGTQIGGAIKNVIAIATGMAMGMGYHENTRAFLITQGLAEMSLIAQHYGGQAQTVYGLSGLGDLLLTCTSTLSKNCSFGFELGKGTARSEIEKKYSALPEGVNTVQSLAQFAQKHDISLPLCIGMHNTIFNNTSFADIFHTLFAHG